MASTAWIVIFALAAYVNAENSVLGVSNQIWHRDRPISAKIGDANTVYCKAEDPSGVTVFENFGVCNIEIEKVTLEHQGVWKVHTGSNGRVMTVESQFTVTVQEADARPVVVTHVEKQRPSVMISCSVRTSSPIQTCKFRDPSGRILLASQGVSEGRFNFYGAGFNGQTHECGLEITEPLTTDLGLWRCALEAEEDTYYGFLSVICPWAMQDPTIAASVVTEPVLTRQREAYTGVTGNSMTLSCSVQSSIRYCYFRSGRNGTVFAVGPDQPSGALEYVGAGFDAGECGMRIPNLSINDNGAWSCHVGFPDSNTPEQRVQFQINVDEAIAVNQVREKGPLLIVTGQVHNSRPVEYCRFVRMDGLGFTTDNLPENYVSTSSISTGLCVLRIREPTILEDHPWTVAAKVRGIDGEVSAQTGHTIEIPVVPQPEGESGDGENEAGPPGSYNQNTWLLWIVIVMLIITITMLGVFMFRKSDRQWMKSLRNSFRKTPPMTVNPQNTAASA